MAVRHSGLSWNCVQSHQPPQPSQKNAWPTSGWTFTQSHKCLHTSVQDSGNTCGISIVFFLFTGNTCSLSPPQKKNKTKNKCWVNHRAGPVRRTLCAPYCLGIDCVISCRADSFIIMLDSRNLWVKFSPCRCNVYEEIEKGGSPKKKQNWVTLKFHFSKY